MEQASLSQQVNIVAVAEAVRALEIERREVAVTVAGGGGTVGAAGGGEGWVDVGLVVDAPAEGRAASEPDSVRTGECSHILRAQPFR